MSTNDNRRTDYPKSRLPLKLPNDLRDAVVAFADGGDERPPSSINAAIVFLLRRGLASLDSDTAPAVRRRVED